ncbi:MAG TPA: response regulator [Candidatus Paceibacterota bacterium]|jgi:two-component system response regulator GlrR|nr:response regulator [Candidatus Paceibacterota bacterium]
MQSDSSSEKRKVLICEDDPGILDAVSLALGSMGFEYDTHGMLEGLEGCIEKVRPDVLLLDLWLGGANGEAILKELMENHPQTQIILMSAHSKLPMIAEKYGVPYLPKPFGIDDLLRAVSAENNESPFQK